MANPYDDIVDQFVKDNKFVQEPTVAAVDDMAKTIRENAGLNILAGSTYNPDEFAEALHLEKKTGVPADAGVKALDQVRTADKRSGYDEILDRNMTLAQIMADHPDLAKAAHDDLPALDRLSKVWGNVWDNAIKPTPSRAFATFQKGVGGMEQWAGENLLQPLINVTMSEAAKAKYGGSNILTERGKFLTEEADMVEEQIRAEHPLEQGSMTEATASALQSMYLQAPFMTMGFLANTARNATAIALTGLGSITGGATYGERRADGFTPVEATASAAWDAAVEVGTEMIPTKAFFSLLKPEVARSLYGMAWKAAQYYGGELAGESLATFLQDANAKFMSDPELSTRQRLDKIGEYVASGEAMDNWVATLKATAIQTTLMGGISGGPAYLRNKQKAREAEANRAVVETLANNGGVDSKLLKRSPELFQRVIESASKAEGGLKNVYIPADQFYDYFAGLPMEELNNLFENVPSLREQLNEAMASGGDIVIPSGEFAAYVAPQHGPAMAKDIRLGPGQFTLREYDDFKKNEPEEYARLKALADEEKARQDEARPQYEAIRERIYAQLQATGKFDDTQADVQADVFARMFFNLAHREGIEADTLLEMMSPKVVADTLQNFMDQRGQAQEEVSEDGMAEDLMQGMEFDPTVSDQDLLSQLEGGETVTVYRAMQLIDGKLYPPMSAQVDGKLRRSSEVGVWEQSQEAPHLADDKGYFKLDKGNKTSLKARYNPYFYTSRSPMNDQFSSAHKRPNLVTVEVEIPKSELTSGYRAEGAKDTVGEMRWNSGPVSGKLKGDKARKVILSRYMKIKRIVPDSEVADHIAEILNGEDITVPENVVTPSLLAELVARGIKTKPGTGNNATRTVMQMAEGGLPAEATAGLVQDSSGAVVFNVEEAARAIGGSETATLFQGVESPTPAGKFMRGTAKTTGLAHEVVADNLTDEILFDFDQVASIEEAVEKASAVETYDPIVLDSKKDLRYDKNENGFYGNEKMAFPNDAYPNGRNSWDIPGCGRLFWASENDVDRNAACYGGACYAEALKIGKQGKDAVVTKGINKIPAAPKDRNEILAFFKENGLEATRKKYPQFEIVVYDKVSKADRDRVAKKGIDTLQNFFEKGGVLHKISVGRFKDAAGNAVSFANPQNFKPIAAVVSTNLQAADGVDIRQGIDTDGSAWLANPAVLDAMLAANPRSVTFYSSAYHTPPVPHPLSGRSIINVTVSGWHPLPETLARLRWAEQARANGWNVILREVVSDPAAFGEETSAVYNRLHEALLKTDFFVMQQSLHDGSKEGAKEPFGLPGCCIGSLKNPGTCDACEVSEGLGKRFQRYWEIAQEDRREEQILPDVPDDRTRTLFQSAREQQDPARVLASSEAQVLQDMAYEQKDEFLGHIDDVVAAVGGEIPEGSKDFAVKQDIDRIADKIIANKDIPGPKITDILRATIAIDDPVSALPGVLAKLQEQGYQVFVNHQGREDVTNRYDIEEGGYKDVAIKIVRAEGDPLVRELLLINPNMYWAKEKFIGHLMYEVSRQLQTLKKVGALDEDMNDVHEPLVKLQTMLYSAAFNAERQDRMNSRSSSVSHPSMASPISSDVVNFNPEDFSRSVRESLNDLPKPVAASLVKAVSTSPGAMRALSVLMGSPPSAPTIPTSETRRNVNVYDGELDELFQSAYHGSPHQFDKFSTDKIGTGEGAQVYGYGLYFASRKEVAEWYKEKLSEGRKAMYKGRQADAYRHFTGAEDKAVRHVLQVMDDQGLSAAEAITRAKKEEEAGYKSMAATFAAHPEHAYTQQVKADAEATIAGFDTLDPADFAEPDKGRLYKVELAPEDDEYLLWDKPLSEQSEKVKAALAPLAERLKKNTLADLAQREKNFPGSVNADAAETIGKQGVIEFLGEDETGEDLYRMVDEQVEGGAKATSEYLHSLGIRGIKYLDGTSRGKGEGNYNFVIFSDDDVQITEMWQRQQQQARGAINLEQNLITLFEQADLTTFLHETGHYYLNLLQALASRPEATEETRKDWNTIQAWLGAAGGRLTVAQHEMFADGFLTYLSEGKAPSQDLEAAFARFKGWLLALWRSFQRVELSDDVRDVFNRMIAGEREVRKAEEEAGYSDLWKTAEEAGMTQQEWQAYKTLLNESRQAAEASLTAELVKQMKREQESAWKGELKKKIALVREELAKRADYRAAAILRHGKLPDGTDVDPELQIKLDSQQLRERYPNYSDVHRTLAFMTRKEGGIDVDTAAELLGFTSGDAMIEALRNLQPIEKAAKDIALERMRQEYGDLQTTGEIKTAAEDAIHNDRRGSLLMVELRKLGQKVGRNISPEQMIKEFAQRVISGKRVMDTDANRYRMDEAKAARAAMKAVVAGDFETAFIEKQKQLMNYHLYREAKAARDNAEKIAKKMRDLGSPAGQARLAAARGPYLDQINELLERFEFKKVTLKTIARRKSPAEFIAEVEKEDDAYVEPWLIDESRRMNYKELTNKEISEVYATVKHLTHLAKLKNKLLDLQEARTVEDAVDEMVLALEQNLKGRKKPPIDRNTAGKLEGLYKHLREVDATLIKVEQLIEWFDGGKIDGAWSRNFWNLFSDAQNRENDLTQKHLQGVARAFSKLGKNPALFKTVRINSLGEDVTRLWAITVALNTGNEGNLERLLKRGHNGNAWSPQVVKEITDVLTEEEWKFVQEIWDEIDSLWPMIVELEQKVRGVPPEKINPTPVVTKFGTMRGGYFPVVYDPDKSTAGRKQASSEERALYETVSTKATTPKGHTKQRIDNFAAPLLLGDLEVVPRHLSSVIHDLTHRTAVGNATKLLGQQALRNAIKENMGEEYVRLLDLWVQNVANDRVLRAKDGTEKWNRVARRLRTNATIVAMGFKATTMFTQLAGYFNSLDQVSAKDLAAASKTFFLNPKQTTEFVFGKSGELRHRIHQRDRDIKDALRGLAGRTDKLARVQETAFLGIGYFDLAVSIPTWLAGYKAALREGRAEEDAIRAGDRAVRLTQGSGSAKDIARIMSESNEFTRLLTMFYSYWSVLYSRLRDLSSSPKISNDKFMRKVARSFWLVIGPAVVAELLAGRWPDDDEEMEPWLLRNLITYPFATIPLLRDLANNLVASQTGVGYKDFQFSPVVAAAEKIARASNDIIDVIQEDKEWDEVSGRVFEASGYLLGLPTAQARITGGYVYDILSGEERPEDFAELMHNLVYRRKEN